MEANCRLHMKIEKKNHKPRKTPISPETQTMATEPIQTPPLGYSRLNPGVSKKFLL